MPSSRRTLGLLTILVLLVALAAPSRGAGGSTGPKRMDRAENCNELTPESLQPAAGTNINLDVLVLLDEVARPSAEAIFDVVADAYVPSRITLVPTYKKATFDPAVTRAEALIDAARTASGGARPAGTDAVYVLTSKNITIGSGDVVGYADCIGGIRYPSRAFAVGEATEAPENTGGLNFYVDGPAKVAAHELGHLLGGRHEQANCAEGASTDDVNKREATVCTLMSNYLDFQSNEFGRLESSVIRSYAERYAGP